MLGGPSARAGGLRRARGRPTARGCPSGGGCRAATGRGTSTVVVVAPTPASAFFQGAKTNSRCTAPYGVARSSPLLITILREATPVGSSWPSTDAFGSTERDTGETVAISSSSREGRAAMPREASQVQLCTGRNQSYTYTPSSFRSSRVVHVSAAAVAGCRSPKGAVRVSPDLPWTPVEVG